MGKHHRARILFAAFLLAAPGAELAAQVRDTGVPTQTQERLSRAQDPNLVWNLIGLLGLLGLLGLRKNRHREDGYHPAPFE